MTVLPDIVYVVKPNVVNEELRYSLRSLANMPHRKVWIAGYRPAWVRDVGHIPTQQLGSKYQNSTGNLRAAIQHPDVAEQFLLFNDDFFIMQQLQKMPVLHRGPVTRVESYYASRAKGQYLRGLRQTKALLAELGHPNPLSYELHVPMPMTKTRALEALETGRHLPVLHKRSLYGNMFELGGRQIPDPKVLTRGPRFPTEAMFLSTMPDTFRSGQVGQFIRRRFPARGPYESGGPRGNAGRL